VFVLSTYIYNRELKVSSLCHCSEVEAPVLVSPAEDALNVSLGDDVTFSVNVSGYNLMYLWELGSGEFLPSSDSRYVGVRSSRLVVSDVRTSDVGDYVCMAANSGGSVSSSARLTIREWLRAMVGVVAGDRASLYSWVWLDVLGLQERLDLRIRIS